MRDTNMGFTRHLAETKQLVKNGMQGDSVGKPEKMTLQAKTVRKIQQEIEEYYGIPQVGFDTDIKYDADDIEAIKYISMGKQLPVDLEQRLLQRKKDRILNNKYSEIKK